MDGSSASTALAILACLVASAFFSGSETALSSISRTRVRQLLDEGGRAAAPLRLWDEQPVYVLYTILIWNNVVNVTASALASQLAEDLMSGLAPGMRFLNPVAVAVGAMKLLLLTFGEITPKGLARVYAERIAVPILVVMRLFYWLSYPVASVFVRLTRGFSRLAGSDVDPGPALVREEDIEYLVRLARRDGSIETDRDRMLRSVFEFSETPARSVMVPRIDIDCVPDDIALDDLIARFLDEGHSRLPVYTDNIDNVVGIVYARDILREVHSKRGQTGAFRVTDSLREARFVPETKPISQLFAEMQKERVHMVILVDEFGGVSGLVTLEDIIEQFFGDIQDEFDAEDEWIQHCPDGSIRFDGRVALAEVWEHISVDEAEREEDDDVDTLGGWVAKVTGTVARRDTVVEGWGWRFRVTDADNRRVKWVHAERNVPAEESAAGDAA